MTGRIDIEPVPGIGEVREGDELGRLVAEAAGRLGDDEVVVISQKVVSKAEGRTRDLSAVRPGPRAEELAAALGKDPRIVELVLGEAGRIVRAERGVLIVETTSGLVCANAGIDTSNVPGAEQVTLLPADPDASARRIRSGIEAAAGTRPAVVVADSFGRPWRLAQVDVAIGCAGLAPVDDWRGRADRHGRELAATAIAVADEVAAAADLARDKTSGVPAAVLRGLGHHVAADDGPGVAALRRAEADDLFR